MKNVNLHIRLLKIKLKMDTTEKIVNAFYSGSIPVYWGSENIGEFFNKKAFINVNDFESIEKCIDYIFNLSDKDREKIYKRTYLYK